MRSACRVWVVLQNFYPPFWFITMGTVSIIAFVAIAHGLLPLVHRHWRAFAVRVDKMWVRRTRSNLVKWLSLFMYGSAGDARDASVWRYVLLYRVACVEMPGPCFTPPLV